MAAVIERAELHKTIWRIANDLLCLFGEVCESLATVCSSSLGKSGVKSRCLSKFLVSLRPSCWTVR